MAKDIFTSLVYARTIPIFGRAAYYLLKLLGIEMPLTVEIGRELEIAHGGFGLVVHPWTRIGDRVKIYPGVSIGRSDIHKPIDQSQFKGIIIADDVILSSGAKILGKEGKLIVGKGSVIGANAVLLQSTGENEVWVGNPAHCIGKRDD
jgi:serine O-acetyltransferase